MKKKQFIVIGLGRFGGSVCKELIQLGNEVLAIDISEQQVNIYKDIATEAIIADATDEAMLRSLDVASFDQAIVALTDDIQASILTTLLLKELGVKKVWTKANDKYHQKVLEKIGADRIVQPETDMGIRIAQQLSNENVIDYIQLSDEYSIYELVAGANLHGKSIIDLNIRAKYGLTILAIKKGEEINISPNPTTLITEGEILIVIGENSDIKRFEELND